MKTANPDLEKEIRNKALELLMLKEPEEIGMREIARACSVTTPTIYYYFKDKDQLFTCVKNDCLLEMDATIAGAISAGTSPRESVRYGLEAFRDWSFENPRVAVLIMGRFKPDSLDTIDEALGLYYRSMNLAAALIEQAAMEGSIVCADPKLASALCVYSLWGVIESVLFKRTFPHYWDRGKELTDASISMCMNYLGYKGA